MFQIISNTIDSQTTFLHNNHITDLLLKADEAVIAVAFMSYSGWEQIKQIIKDHVNSKKGQLKFFVGTGDAITDPRALKELYNTIKKHKKHQMFLCTPDDGIFHSKIYLFKSEGKQTLVIGSANLTTAGFLNNDEVSLSITINSDAAELKQLLDYFSILETKYSCENLSELLSDYEAAAKQYKEKNKGSQKFKFRRHKNSNNEVDIEMLRHNYQLYPYSGKYYVDPSKRVLEYKTAKLNLETLASDVSLSDFEFENLFKPLMGHSGYTKLWHSGSIHRHTHETLNFHKEGFRSLIRFVKQTINLPAGQAFEDSYMYLKKMKKDKKLFGVSENILTEIMMTYNPLKFANLNVNPVDALRKAGCVFPSPSSFKGETYERYLHILNLIKTDLKMETFLEIDSFFNFMYWDE
ncbi:restriction endonuclease PLD domain-containing protein [Chitinophaga sp. RCC_12]|uniref:restriction endonuclease PLD domain-containing protein n=1 Tax=Chitinophaga sp. RCC_12 TaxID=3239226 RepID=UPI0035246DB3